MAGGGAVRDAGYHAQESFTKDDEHLLGTFMAQAGLAIKNERLHARVQALEERVQALEAGTGGRHWRQRLRRRAARLKESKTRQDHCVLR
eukprot:COSAG06_NODE_17462_length_939_cov_8.851190_2_plen_90_part_00